MMYRWEVGGTELGDLQVGGWWGGLGESQVGGWRDGARGVGGETPARAGDGSDTGDG